MALNVLAIFSIKDLFDAPLRPTGALGYSSGPPTPMSIRRRRWSGNDWRIMSLRTSFQTLDCQADIQRPLRLLGTARNADLSDSSGLFDPSNQALRTFLNCLFSMELNSNSLRFGQTAISLFLSLLLADLSEGWGPVRCNRIAPSRSPEAISWPGKSP